MNITSPGVIGSAKISDDGLHRYRLWRAWPQTPGCRGAVLWVMLNPSTADASKDDPTIRRCIRFSQRWGFGSMLVGNIYSIRSSTPGATKNDFAFFGTNRNSVKAMIKESELLVCAWGNRGYTSPPDWLRMEAGKLWCLGRSTSGAPLHPLARGKSFVPYERPLVEFA